MAAADACYALQQNENAVLHHSDFGKTGSTTCYCGTSLVATQAEEIHGAKQLIS